MHFKFESEYVMIDFNKFGMVGAFGYRDIHTDNVHTRIERGMTMSDGDAW